MRKKFEKNLTMPKKLKVGLFGIFQHPYWRKIPKKEKGDPLAEKILGKKSQNAEKRDPLYSPGNVCYAKKR